MLKVGVVGVGGIAGAHMPGWEASEHAEVVAGSDISEDALKRWGAQYGVKRLVTDPAELFSDPDIDIIDVCTPNNYHAPLSIAAMEAGKHVLCEKPLAATPDEILKMIDVRDKTGRTLMTAQHFRYQGTARAMKAELDTGALGDVYHARSWLLRRAGVPLRPGFFMKKHSGGGPCIDIGVHILDLTLWFMGNPEPAAVSGIARADLARQEGSFSAWGGDIPPEFDVEEFAAAFVRFAGGQTLILEVSWLLHHASDQADDMQMWLYGTKGGSHWPRCEVFDANNATKQHYNRTLRIIDQPLAPHAAECVAFAQAVVDGAPSPVPAEQSLQVMRILDGVYRSQAAGAEVRLDG